MSEHVSFKLEYDYVKFETANFNAFSNDFAVHTFGPVARSAISNLNMVKDGIAYRF
jgi:opacity protein-like surface antigen